MRTHVSGLERIAVQTTSPAGAPPLSYQKYSSEAFRCALRTTIDRPTTAGSPSSPPRAAHDGCGHTTPWAFNAVYP